MWQHRQEERDLKRAENDIRRNQRELKRSLKHYELGQLTVRHPSFILYVRIWSCSLSVYLLTYVCTYVRCMYSFYVRTYVYHLLCFLTPVLLTVRPPHPTTMYIRTYMVS